MKQFLTYLKIEGKLSLRCPDGLIFGVGMPVGILFLIAVIGGGKSVQDAEYTFLQSAFASLMTVGICATAFMGLPLNFADYRDKKILKHFFVTPVSPGMMLFVQGCIGTVTAIISASAVAMVSIWGFGYHMKGNLVLFIGAFFLVLYSMYSIGMLIASLCPTVKIANVVSTFIYFPMLFLSGATIPYEIFPEFLKKIADILPLTYGVRLLKEISLGIYSSTMWTSVGILSAFAVFGSILSVVVFRWE